ncbi:MAG: hypothetical protein AB1595_07670 [bacterium]
MQPEGDKYKMSLSLSPGEYNMAIVSLKNPKGYNWWDRNKIIELNPNVNGLKVNEEIFLSYTQNPLIDNGNPFDPLSMQDGKEASLSPGNKAINFKIPIDPTLTLGDEEIATIPEFAPLYKDGTLVQRDENSPLYLIFKGERHLIENNLLTLKLYGLSAQNIRKIGEVIDQIKEGEPLPKYPERTLIKDGNNTFYLIQENKIYKVPDNETLEAMGLLKDIKEREISIKAIGFFQSILHLSYCWW